MSCVAVSLCEPKEPHRSGGTLCLSSNAVQSGQGLGARPFSPRIKRRSLSPRGAAVPQQAADGADIGWTGIGAGVGDCSVLRTDTVSMVGRAIAPFPPALGPGLREFDRPNVDGGHN